MKISTGINNIELEITRTILTFGKTGTGKSSILNSLCGKVLFKEGDLSDPFSTTKQINAKISTLQDTQFSCLFIDTPGSNDSQNNDKENMLSLYDFTEKSGFNIILFTHSILEKKIDMTMHNAIEVLIKIFGPAVMERTYFIITHLNSLVETKLAEKIALLKAEFNNIIKTNKNSLLFFEYDKPNGGEDLVKIKENIKNSNTYYIPPMSKENLIKLDLLNITIDNLVYQNKLFTEEFTAENNKFLLNKKNIETDLIEKDSKNVQILLNLKLQIENDINNNFLVKNQENNNFIQIKNNEFNAFQKERLNHKSGCLQTFLLLGGNYVGNDYTMNGNNVQAQFDKYNEIITQEILITDKATSINAEINQKAININNELSNYKSSKANEFTMKQNSILAEYDIQKNMEQKTLDLKLKELLLKKDELELKINLTNSELLDNNCEKRFLLQRNKFLKLNIQLADEIWSILKIESYKELEGEISNKLNNILIPLMFDLTFSKDYYVFSSNYTNAAFQKESVVNDSYKDYCSYPVARIQKLFKNKFIVKFKINGYGWFGLAREDLVAEGFPGYTDKGWMICTDGRLMHDKSEIFDFFINSQGKEILFECDLLASSVRIECLGSKKGRNSFVIRNLPKECYFVVSVSKNVSVDLIDLQFND